MAEKIPSKQVGFENNWTVIILTDKTVSNFLPDHKQTVFSQYPQIKEQCDFSSTFNWQGKN